VFFTHCFNRGGGDELQHWAVTPLCQPWVSH
jgi:hypothetical protein